MPYNLDTACIRARFQGRPSPEWSHERTSGNVLAGRRSGKKKALRRECLHLHEQIRVVSVSVRGRRKVGQKARDSVKHVAIWLKKVDLEDPTPLLHQVYLGCTTKFDSQTDESFIGEYYWMDTSCRVMLRNVQSALAN